MNNDKILEICKHISKYEPSSIEKSISGSQIGDTMLQLVLANKFAKDEGAFRVGQNTVGSIFHKGMEVGASEIFGEEVATELEVSKELYNGWTITGTIDFVDYENKEIVDYKTGKSYGLSMQKKEPRHTYNYQLNAYKWASGLEDYSMFDAYFLKDNKDLAGEPVYVKHRVNEIPTFVEEVVMITDEITEWLLKDELPPKCDDVWLRMDTTKAKGGKLVPSRCMLYCGVNKVCPHFDYDWYMNKLNIKRLTNA